MALPTPPSLLCALVLLDGAEQPDQVVVVFHVPHEAEAFAHHLGAADYRVVPLRFVAELT